MELKTITLKEHRSGKADLNSNSIRASVYSESETSDCDSPARAAVEGPSFWLARMTERSPSLLQAPFWISCLFLTLFCQTFAASSVQKPSAIQKPLSDLLVTEIMYHPPANGAIDGDEFEFLELKNAGASSLDLGGAYFTNGVTYAFPAGTVLSPGQFYVLASNAARFNSTYPGVVADANYIGRLSNGGENVRLVDAVGTTIFSVSYLDRSPWPATPDGEGFSLAPVNPNSNVDLDDSANWRASSAIGGSPGSDDPSPTFDTVWITEVLTHTDLPLVDAIELHNPTGNNVNVGNWFLTDERNTPIKFRIAPDTVIPAGGYRVFTEADFNTTPGSGLSFSLSSHGEQVYLFAADSNGNLLGFSDGFNFRAAENGVTFGRHTTSIGEVQYPAQVSRSLGIANLGPRVGPVVINEIRYHPTNGKAEFIELKNITSNPVPLYDPSFPINRWRLNGVGFDFPEGIEISANGLIVVSGNDPNIFRTSNSIGQEVQVLGPFLGLLQDSGERLQLERPDTPDVGSAGEVIVPYIVVDEVRYNDKAPWPVNADGSGPSLERIQFSVYGNDPVNWRASPGVGSAGLENGGNIRPIVSVGTDRKVEAESIPFSINLNGTVTDDGLPNPPASFSSTWAQVSGPGTVVFNSLSDLNTTASFSAVGAYTLRLTVTDGALEATDEIRILIEKPTIPDNPIPPAVRSPAITTQPQSQTAAKGGSVAFTVETVGTSPLHYQWSRSGVEVVGATDSGLLLHNVMESDGGTYTVRVSNTGGSVMSTVATLTVSEEAAGPAPVIVVQPVSQTIDAGDKVQFTVLATGIGPLFYQWRKNKQAIVEGTGGLLIFRNARLSTAGRYTVSVSNAKGNVTSKEVELIVNPSEGKHLPVIGSQPSSVRATVGETILFTVLAEGTGPFNYQWQRDGMDLVGRNSAVLQLSDIEITDAGRYSVLVTNEQGSVVSAEATLTVSVDSEIDNSAPTLIAHPSNQTVGAGGRAIFSTEAAGAAPLSYQWKKNGLTLEGATDANLILESVSVSDEGQYSASVKNDFGSATGTSAFLKVLIPPSIIVQPLSKTVKIGATVTFTVAGSGTGPLRYEWIKDGSVIPGATEVNLVVENVREEDSGEFSVLASNEIGSVTSATATLTVLPVPSTVRNDLNGDGSSDIVFQDKRGFLAAWLMDGTSLNKARFLSPDNVGNPHWKLAGAGNLNGDNQVDLIFQHLDGSLAVWQMNGTKLDTAELITPPTFGAVGWKLAAVGDFDRNGMDDLVFQHSTGEISVWFLDGTKRIASTLTEPNGPRDALWKVVTAGDFDSDGMQDLVFQHADGSIAIWQMTGIRLQSAVIPHPGGSGDPQWRVTGSGDYNDDGKVDLVFQHESHGTAAVWLMEETILKEARLLNPANAGGTWRIRP